MSLECGHMSSAEGATIEAPQAPSGGAWGGYSRLKKRKTLQLSNR